MHLLDLFSNFIFGILEDNTRLFVIPHFVNALHGGMINNIGYPFGYNVNIYTDNQLLFWLVYYLFSGFFRPDVFYNFAVLATFILVFFSSLWTFKKFIKNNMISVLVSVLFLLSGYFSYQIRSHLDLAQIWLFLIFINIWTTAEFKYKFPALGVLLGIITGISNYMGYFIILFVGSYFFSKQIIYKLIYKYSYWNRKIISNYIQLFFVFFVSISLFLMPYIKANYFTSELDQTAGLTVDRTIEDFIILSSRPWYYIIPSTDNPFFGNISKQIIDWLENDWGYFLAKNYFKSEHSASYLGWANMLTAAIGGIVIYKKLKSPATNTAEDKEMPVLALVAVFMVILSLPPFFSVSGCKIFMPSYLLWIIFPMFRSLSRLGVITLFITLLFSGYGYKHILGVKSKFFGLLLVVISFIIGIMEFTIPIKIADISRKPKAYTYIKDNTAPDASITVYPYSKTNLAYFWLPYYNRPLVNPWSYSDPKNNFKSEEYTKNLLNCEGLTKARDLGTDYILLFPRQSNEISLNIFNYYKNAGFISEVAAFSEEPNYHNNNAFSNFIQISSTNESDSAILYSVNNLSYNTCTIPAKTK